MDPAAARAVRRAARENEFGLYATIAARIDNGDLEPGYIRVFDREFARAHNEQEVTDIYREFLEDLREYQNIEDVETQLVLEFTGIDADGNEETFHRSANGGRKKGWVGIRDHLPETFADLGMNRYGEHLQDVRFTGMSINTREREGAGGDSADKDSNCLLKCLESRITTLGKRANPFKYGFKAFRKKAGLPAGPIAVEDIHLIEDAVPHWRFVVHQGGRVIYRGPDDPDSAGRTVYTCQVVLNCKHYSLACAGKSSQGSTAHTDLLRDLGYARAPIIYEKRGKSYHLWGRDGEEDVSEIKFKKMNDSDKVSFRRRETGPKVPPPREQLKIWNKQRDALRKLTEGKIDLFSRGQPSQIALDYFLAQMPVDVEPIEDLEQQEWMRGCQIGAIIASRPGKIANATCIDMNAMYMSILKRTNIDIPIAEGRFEKRRLVPEELSIRSPNIWRVHLENVPAPWRANPEDLYRESELQKLLRFGATSSKVGKRCRVLVFEKVVSMYKMFSGFVKPWMAWEDAAKAAGDEDARRACKSISRSCWGILCQSAIKRQHWTFQEGTTETKRVASADIEILSATKTEGGLKVEFRPVGEIFKGVLPQIGYNILSAARVTIAMACDDLDRRGLRWRRVHTDGIVFEGSPDDLLKKPEPVPDHFWLDFKISEDLGKYKVEHQGRSIVHNSMDVEWPDEEP